MMMTRFYVVIAVLSGLGMSALMLDRSAAAAEPLLMNLLADRSADIPERATAGQGSIAAEPRLRAQTVAGHRDRVLRAVS